MFHISGPQLVRQQVRVSLPPGCINGIHQYQLIGDLKVHPDAVNWYPIR
jgi:hypothetical protein